MSKSLAQKLSRMAGRHVENPLDPLTPDALRIITDLAILFHERNLLHMREVVRQAARSCPDRGYALQVVEALLEAHLVEQPGGMVAANPDADLGRIFRPPTSNS